MSYTHILYKSAIVLAMQITDSAAQALPQGHDTGHVPHQHDKWESPPENYKTKTNTHWDDPASIWSANQSKPLNNTTSGSEHEHTSHKLIDMSLSFIDQFYSRKRNSNLDLCLSHRLYAYKQRGLAELENTVRYDLIIPFVPDALVESSNHHSGTLL